MAFNVLSSLADQFGSLDPDLLIGPKEGCPESALRVTKTQLGVGLVTGRCDDEVGHLMETGTGVGKPVRKG
jgi:hypothetical protein